MDIHYKHHEISSERKGGISTSKTGNHTSLSLHVKNVWRFFCLCMLMFCTDDRCYLPMHNLITDMVESCGGSTLLVKILNRTGVFFC